MTSKSLGGALTLSTQKYVASLLQALEDRGINCQQEFSVDLDDKREVRLDLYVPAPQRAFLEIKRAERVSKGVIDGLRSFIANVSRSFGGSILAIVVVHQSSYKQFSRLISPGVVVLDAGEMSSVSQELVVEIEAVIRTVPDKFFASILSKDEELDRLKDVGQMADILVTFRPLLERDKFYTLRLEIAAFVMEYNAGHYTAAALRVGRTVEFIVYTLAICWGVTVNKITLHAIEELEARFAEVRESLIIYAQCESDERLERREGVKRSIRDLEEVIAGVSLEIDQNVKPDQKAYPISVTSILTDAKRTHSHLKEVEDELRALSKKGGEVGRLLNRRNMAAHADTSGNRKELERTDVDEMIKLLRTILFRLANIATCIASDRAV